MNTIVEQGYCATDTSSIERQIKTCIEDLEASMSFFLPTSDITSINQASGITAIEVSPSLFTVLQKSEMYATISDGLFDITIAPLTEIWRQHKKVKTIPSFREIEEKRQFVGLSQLLLNNQQRTAFLQTNGAQIEVGGIAKGYAVDCCIDIYKEHSVQSAMINFGGNLKAIGCNNEGEKWNVGIQSPNDPRGNWIASVAITNMAVSTSGGYERFFESQGQLFHHIIDPRNGFPIQTDIESSTIICESALDADALSTITFMLGLEQAITFIKRYPTIEAIFITEKKLIYVTAGILDDFKLNPAYQEYQCLLIK